MRPDEIALVAGLCQARAGLKIAERAYLIESRLDPVARAAGLAGLSEMLAAIRAGHDQVLVWRVVEAMTASETSFFRDRGPFELLQHKLLPQLIVRRSRQRSLRLWSAACSSGSPGCRILQDGFG